MTEEKIKRINELAKKDREVGLTDEEKEERLTLRQEYIAAFRKSMESQLDNVYMINKDGKEVKLEKKAAKPKH